MDLLQGSFGTSVRRIEKPSNSPRFPFSSDSSDPTVELSVGRDTPESLPFSIVHQIRSRGIEYPFSTHFLSFALPFHSPLLFPPPFPSVTPQRLPPETFSFASGPPRFASKVNNTNTTNNNRVCICRILTLSSASVFVPV